MRFPSWLIFLNFRFFFVRFLFGFLSIFFCDFFGGCIIGCVYDIFKTIIKFIFLCFGFSLFLGGILGKFIRCRFLVRVIKSNKFIKIYTLAVLICREEEGQRREGGGEREGEEEEGEGRGGRRRGRVAVETHQLELPSEKNLGGVREN